MTPTARAATTAGIERNFILLVEKRDLENEELEVVFGAEGLKRIRAVVLVLKVHGDKSSTCVEEKRNSRDAKSAVYLAE